MPKRKAHMKKATVHKSKKTKTAKLKKAGALGASFDSSASTSPSNTSSFGWTKLALQRLPVSKVEAWTPVTEQEARGILQQYPEIAGMLDRTGSVPVEMYILSTLSNGLPLFQDQPTINEEIKQCLNYIFHRVGTEEKASERKRLVMEVARAYQQCQTIQQQTISGLYASLVNVELGFEKQVSQMLSQFKLQKLDQVVFLLNPGANDVSDSHPNRQTPHLRSAYLCALDKKGIGLDGIEAARADANAPLLSEPQIKKVFDEFMKLFSVQEFISDFMNDLNHATGFSHHVDRDKFFQWVMKLPGASSTQGAEKDGEAEKTTHSETTTEGEFEEEAVQSEATQSGEHEKEITQSEATQGEEKEEEAVETKQNESADKKESMTFDKHSIFYSEERAEEYDAPQREEDRGLVPYLSKKVAKGILQQLGLVI
eukprot:gb/GEZN01005386.1/.p1 GENE.gb/GEZN01005386.1/~~gb/GEZN01005386.1/.p1  ORF type:complete len:440 (-),score=97.62 gb/GEZN01005386.1/:491-1771(-)